MSLKTATQQHLETPSMPSVAESHSNPRYAVFSAHADSLTAIYEETINLAVWQRNLAPELAAASADLLRSGMMLPIQVTLVPATIESHLAAALPDIQGREYLIQDIRMLAEMFSCLFGMVAIGLRVTPLHTAMCPKFHVDRVPCRLITTYCGSGSQWLPHDRVDRSKLGLGSAGLNDGESGLYARAEDIRQLAAGDVALLKGELWEGNENGGVVHRSPAFADGERRLLLTMDFTQAS